MINCRHKADCPYSQPFFVGRNSRKFKYARNGYLQSSCEASNGCDRYAPEATQNQNLTEIRHQVMYDHSDISPQNLKRLARIESDLNIMKRARVIKKPVKKPNNYKGLSL